MDLGALPAPDVVEALDYEAVLAAMLADYRMRWPEFSAWLESEPALKLLEAAAYREMLLRARVNDAARACMLPTAEGADLDNLAALFGVERLPGGEADAALRERATLSLGAHNTAGSAAGYRYWALRVPGVHHVCVDSARPGEVRVIASGRVTGEGAAALDGQIDGATLAALRAALDADETRPVTDRLNARAVEIEAYRVTAALTLERDVPAGGREAVRAAAEASAREHCAREHECQGAVRRSAITAALHVPGVLSVALTEPAADFGPTTRFAPWPTVQVPAGSEYGDGAPGPDDVPTRHPMDGITVTLA